MINVLIVEDDPMVAQINKRYTESIEGFKVIGVCGNGNEALNTIKTKQMQLVILDLYMPKLDGIEFLKEIRKEHIMTDVIMVTAAHETNKLNEVLKLGAIDYLVKPFEYERFKEALNKFKLRYELLKEKSTLNQEDIDKITSQNSPSLSEEFQKGINERTLYRIKKFIKDYREEYFTSEEIAEGMKLSRVTIRRYLEYMSSFGELIRDIEYGEVGRPKTKYKISIDNKLTMK
ncbi:response regulator [Clostridium sp. BSD9I1]|uniref:response regulator n=1 Tax=Clostridium sp. BSD9I1 TaxID=2003589 RepID=UPI00164675E5|nr:response regulator [Clostridium sp. BSD9I1]